MKHLFVPYELALKLKEKGFDEPCFACYNLDKHFFVRHIGNCLGSDEYTNNSVIPDDYGIFSAPLYQQVVDWFREKKKIHLAASSYPIYADQHGTQVWRGPHSLSNGWNPLQGKTYYEALNKAIEEALKLI